MSVRRYSVDYLACQIGDQQVMEQKEDGEWVLFEDYAALEYINEVLQGQVERLQMVLSNTVEHAQSLANKMEQALKP